TKHAPGTQAGSEATAARVVFDARTEKVLEYFEPVATLPGFPRALARTLHELRLARVGVAALERGDEPGLRDLARLLTRLDAQLELAAVDDRAALFAAAAAACRGGGVRWARLPMLLLDIPIDSPAEQDFVASLAQQAPEILATMPDGDEFARRSLSAL